MNNIEIDPQLVLNLFADLTGKELKKSKKQALRKAANILVKTSRQELKQQVNNASKKSIKYNSSLTGGIKVNVVSDEEAKVHIMGDFRLKFFELGTKDRYTKGHKIMGYNNSHSLKRSGKGGYKGKINALYFFKNAQEKSERQVFDSLDALLSLSIQKIAEKHKS